ncbi:MAG TPA: nitroreductase/quinone reductase family protein [Candidatus Binataceae bacterium]|nr:nitroreductase/quinone reductase family protein [Candidatus Binataceae bacterium]
MADPKFKELTPIERIFNRLMGRAVRVGASPRYMRLLEVPGRKSGKVFATAVNLLDYDGRRWLVAARGDTAWSRNARAAATVTLRRGQLAEVVKLRELGADEKPPILKAYLDRFASQVQRFFDVPAGSRPEVFRASAARMPVFEILDHK